MNQLDTELRKDLNFCQAQEQTVKTKYESNPRQQTKHDL